MHNQRGFVGVGILIAIILGIVVLGGGAYFIVHQQSSPQTASDTGDTGPIATGATTNKVNVVFNPTLVLGDGKENVSSVDIKKGDRATLSWNVPEASTCQIDVFRNINYPDSFDILVRDLKSIDTQISDPIFYKQKYRLVCRSSQRAALLSSSVEFKPLSATRAPTCTLTVNPTTAQEGQIVMYNFSETDAATIALGALPAEPITEASFSYPKKAGVGSPTLTIKVENEVGSATCSATVKVVPATGGVQIQTLQVQTQAAISRDSLRVSDINQIQTELEFYYNDNNAYPASLASLASSNWRTVPKDPFDNNSYLYDQLQGGASYELGANLETSSSALSKDASDSVVAGGNITSGVDNRSCTGTTGRYCYNVVAP